MAQEGEDPIADDYGAAVQHQSTPLKKQDPKGAS
jgi:hypothetical protein